MSKIGFISKFFFKRGEKTRDGQFSSLPSFPHWTLLFFLLLITFAPCSHINTSHGWFRTTREKKRSGCIILSNRRRLHHICIEDNDDGNLLFFYIKDCLNRIRHTHVLLTDHFDLLSSPPAVAYNISFIIIIYT
jgi:hypothetical protein